MRAHFPQNINISITAGSIIKIAIFALLVAGIFFFWDIILIVLTAVVIASATEPLTRFLVRHKIPRTLAVVLLYIGIVLGIAGVVYFFLPPVLQEATGLLQTLPDRLDTDVLFGTLPESTPSIFRSGIEELSQNLSLQDIVTNLQGLVSGASASFLQIVSTVFGGLMSFVLIIVLSFYLSVQQDGVGQFLHIITPRRHEGYIMDLWRRSQEKIGKWMQGQIVLAVIVGVLVYLGLMILGVRYALLLALVSAVFEIIPIFGPILAAIPAVIVAFISGGTTDALLVIGLYTIVQQFEAQLIHPLVVRKVVGIPPLMVILALIIGGRLAGFLGILLSVPLAAVLREFLNDFERRKMAEEREQEKLSSPA